MAQQSTMASNAKAGTLPQLSKVLDVPVAFFFEGLEENDAELQKPNRSEPSQQQ